VTTLPPSCADVMESGNLIFLETSGPLQVCNGTDLPLRFTVILRCSIPVVVLESVIEENKS